MSALLPLALAREDVADYVSALFLVYIVLIFLNVLSGWVPRMPYTPGCGRRSTSSARPPIPTSTCSGASSRHSAAAVSRSISVRSSA